MNYSWFIKRTSILLLLCSVFIPTVFSAQQFQMEWGNTTSIAEEWLQINVSTYFEDPIVVATPQYRTTTDPYGISAWVTNVTNQSFMLRTSDENLNSKDNITVNYIIMERGSWTLPNTSITVEADSLNTDKVGTQGGNFDCPANGDTISFNTPFSSNPLVLSVRGSNTNPNAWATTFQNDPGDRAQPVPTNQMCIGLSQSKANSPGTISSEETIYWIAMDEGNGKTEGFEFEILWNLQDTGDSGGNWIDGYADAPPFTQGWAHSWTGTPSIILGGQTSVNGGDGGWPVIYDDENTASIEIFIDEANERSHSGSESGGGWAFDTNGSIQANSYVNWTKDAVDLGFSVITNGSVVNSTTFTAYKTNSNTSISCLSGNCSIITSNWTQQDTFFETKSVEFSCSNQTTGEFWAEYGISSIEDTSQDSINVSCKIFREFGDLSITLDEPSSPLEVIQNGTYSIKATLSCSGETNTSCGNVSGFARYNGTSRKLGDGSDGSLSVASMNTVVNTYSYLTGEENSGVNSIEVNDGTKFSSDDEVLIIQMQNGTGSATAGVYEFIRIDSISGNTLNLKSGLKNSYQSGTFDVSGAKATQVVKVPQYTTVSISTSGSITAPAWDGYSGGIVAFRATDEIVMNGFVNVSEKGFRGGTCGPCSNSDWGTQGEGYPGLGGDSLTPNGNGGGGGYGPTGEGGEPGGGGGYATPGDPGQGAQTAQGGKSVGVANLSTLLFGGGGGAGGDNDDFTPFPENTHGGGIAIVFGKNISSAKIHAKGEKGVYPGDFGGTSGSGAGGSIWLKGEDVILDDVNASGGAETPGSDSDIGGAGGDGRIRIDSASITGNSDPSSGFTGTFDEISSMRSISTNSSQTPFWTSTQPLKCGILDEGENCVLTWTINATGPINSNHTIDVITNSDVIVVDSKISSNQTITITNNIVPLITLYTPADNAKILSNDAVNFTWNIEDDDSSLPCDLIVNGSVVRSLSCISGSNTTKLINLSPGEYNWSVEVNDTDNNKVLSSINEFIYIEDVKRSVNKSITSLSTSNLYHINITATGNGSIFDVVPDRFNFGSVSPPEDFLFPTSLYNGSVLGWNNTSAVEYSITNNNPTYFLSNTYIIGLE